MPNQITRITDTPPRLLCTPKKLHPEPYKSSPKEGPTHTHAHTMIPIPDHPSGERFCRKCGKFLPLEDFFKGKKRRYECKAHSRGRPRKAPAKRQRPRGTCQQASQSPKKKTNATARVWHAAYTDCRSSFGQHTVGMSQAELRELFESAGVEEPSTEFRLVPVDPCRALERGNARLVRREVRIRALRAWWEEAKKACGKGEDEEAEDAVGSAREAYMAVLHTHEARDNEAVARDDHEAEKEVDDERMEE